MKITIKSFIFIFILFHNLTTAGPITVRCMDTVIWVVGLGYGLVDGKARVDIKKEIVT